MKLFVAYALERSHLKALERRIDLVTTGAAQAGYDTYAYVRDGQNWKIGSSDFRAMMETVFSEIRSSDVVLIDLTSLSGSKRTGLNIELGYALASKKPIIAMFLVDERPKMNTDLADIEFGYRTLEEIPAKVTQALRSLT